MLSPLEIFAAIGAGIAFAEGIRRGNYWSGEHPEFLTSYAPFEEVLKIRALFLTSVCLFFLVASRALRVMP